MLFGLDQDIGFWDLFLVKMIVLRGIFMFYNFYKSDHDKIISDKGSNNKKASNEAEEINSRKIAYSIW